MNPPTPKIPKDPMDPPTRQSSSQTRTSNRLVPSSSTRATTPQLSRSTASNQYTSASSTLRKRRETVLDDIGSADEVPVETLFHAVLPSVSPQHITAVVETLVQENDLSKKVLSQTGWLDFQIPPRQQTGTEDSVFQPFSKMFVRVVEAAETLFPTTVTSKLTLGVHGNQIPRTDWPNCTRPDASIHLKDTSLPYGREAVYKDDTTTFIIDHADICCYAEFKKIRNQENIEDNVRKVIYSAHHRFRCDPRCRFVFGLTIEDTMVRFWHFNRSAVSVSESFDFNANKELLVHIFLALVRGSMSQLGFDTSIRCVGPEEGAQNAGGIAQKLWELERSYDFEVHPRSESQDEEPLRRFRTISCITNHGAIGIRARGTRVYKGSEINNDNWVYVLKDSWIDEDRVAEGVILMRIREGLKETEAQFLRHFLQVECHGVVMVENQRDIVASIEGEWPRFSVLAKEQMTASDELVRGLKGSSGYGQNTPRNLIGRNGDPRKHYRIVFKGPPGNPIRDLGLDDAFNALHGGLTAALALYHRGLIHRDISSGNILSVNGVGVLIDLEYAKSFPDISGKAHDYRTGTRQFMSIEVAAEEFLFEQSGLSHSIAWFHNPIHDIESMWWLAVRIFYQQPNASEQDKMENGVLFPDFGVGRRESIFTLGNVFLRACNRPPEEVRKILDSWRRRIVGAFTEMQSGLKDGSYLSFDYNRIFQDSLQFVSQIQQALSDPVVHMGSVQDEDAMVPSDEGDNGTEGGPPKKRRKTSQGDKDNDKDKDKDNV